MNKARILFLGLVVLLVSFNFGLRSNISETSAALCVLKNIYWTQENSRQGNIANFKIDGQDCPLERVKIEVWISQPVLSDSKISIDDIDLNFPREGNQVIGSWPVAVSTIAVTDSQLYLKAKLVNSSGTGTTLDSKILGNSFLIIPPPNSLDSQVDITKFEMNPKQFPANQVSAFTIFWTAKARTPTWFGINCRQVRASLVDNSGKIIYTQEPKSTSTSQAEYSFDLNSRYDAKNDGTDAIRGKLECGDFGFFRPLVTSEPVYITIGRGGGNGCGTLGQPACKPGQDQKYSFEIPNPLKGGATDFTSLVKIIAQWIFNLAIPIAVAMIVYSGILFLTAAGEPAKVTKAKDVLKWAVVGLAIILIGSGFVTLIQSILKLGGTGQPTQQGPVEPGPVYGPVAPGAVGNKCSRAGDCDSRLICKNTICQKTTGNWAGEPCAGTTNCDAGLICDRSNPQPPIDGQDLGLCVQTVGTGGQLGDSCQRDNQCVGGGLKCNQICQRKDGNSNGEACLKTSNPSNCKSRACSTTGTATEGICVEYGGT